jgi:hypothetical protein
VAVKAALLGKNVPVPPDHIPVVEPPDTVPERTAAGLFLQKLKFTPALTTGDGVKVILTVSVTELQFPLLVEVKTNFTNPAVNSDALAVYVAVSAELLGLKEPEPPVQSPVVVGPVTTPESAFATLFLQAVKSIPAFAVGGFV